MTKPAAPKPPAPPHPATPAPGEDQQEDDLDEALRETFPASDPIAVDPDRPDK
ncbi:hypothetical protein [Cupriavidus basilensis]|uniref:hypothetical protein n=1 Tax=Cupriavidus basilensis TaxID=68895 RepID=UPI000B26D950|nr:hypothetical protein [Cupriavidus basilensis]